MTDHDCGRHGRLARPCDAFTGGQAARGTQAQWEISSHQLPWLVVSLRDTNGSRYGVNSCARQASVPAPGGRAALDHRLMAVTLEGSFRSTTLAVSTEQSSEIRRLSGATYRRISSSINSLPSARKNIQ